ncbi:MAG: extracellular solute-binding protein [Paracoccaceae bacterium]|nr:extracellular solute-binding protein [Paracoccaceae bacterium]
MRWKNFVPAYEIWFNDIFVKDWGEENDTDVIVTNVGLGEIRQRAVAEIAAGKGHDMVLFLSPKPSFEDHAIDHREIHEECELRFGKAHGFVGQSNVNPRSGVHHGFIESFAPTLLTYRKDIWDAVGTSPSTWDDIRKAGRAAKLLHNAPVGISFAPEHNAEHSLRALMATFGASVQTVDGRLSLASPNTLEALKFGKALFEETMSSNVLNWTSSSNNLAILSGDISLTIDTMSIIRAAEAKALPIEADLALASLPEGPFGGGGPAYATNTYVVWKFARNIQGAQKFLLDYLSAFGEGLIHSGFQNMPSYPGTVPDLAGLIGASKDKKGRYDVLLKLADGLTNLGYPGHSNAATEEVLNRRIISAMFARVASGSATPQEAMELAQTEVFQIFRKWRDAGKI